MKYINRLKKYRQFKGYDQKELAKILKVSFNTISNWETGKRNPDIIECLKISKIFDEPIENIWKIEE